jgi:hypothetical protein
MTRGMKTKDAPHTFSDEELDWIEEHMPELRRSVSGQQILGQSLGIGFVIGLAAHISGYLLRSAATTGALALVADLLYALGWALWTGVVVAVFVQIIPEAKRRQVKRALDAYGAALEARKGKTAGLRRSQGKRGRGIGI